MAPGDERTAGQSAAEPLANEERRPDIGGEAAARPRDSSRPRPLLGARFGALFEVLLCSGFPTQLFVAQMLALAGVRPFVSGDNYSLSFVVMLLLGDALLLVALVLAFLFAHGERPATVLLGRRPAWREALLGILLVPVVFLVATVVLVLVQILAPGLHNVVRNPLEMLIRTPGDAALLAVVAVISGGVREEVQRAFILHRFEQYLGGAPVGLVLFSLVFGAGHAIQGWDAVVTTAALGALWGAIYLVRRSIVAPMVSHAGFDLAEIVRYAAWR